LGMAIVSVLWRLEEVDAYGFWLYYFISFNDRFEAHEYKIY